jgi:hypothetical protein
MWLIIRGAQPPRLLFGAPRAEHSRRGNHQSVDQFRAFV